MIKVTASTGDATFDAYLATPDQPPSAGVIVVQEVFGVNKGIRQKCEHLASIGYLAIAPDLFWRLQPGVELDADIPAELQQALNLMARFDQDQGVKDIAATIVEARARLPSYAKVGCVGYCLGGRLAYMAASRTDVDASVGYYAVGVDGLLGEAANIARPLMLHIAGDDHYVSAEVQRAMHEGLDGHPCVTLHDYPGEDHGFAAQTGSRRSPDAAAIADCRTEEFLATHLA